MVPQNYKFPVSVMEVPDGSAVSAPGRITDDPGFNSRSG